mmetsp:Transcript_21968/g.76075  ORF Transcript_21968/g.76075 Transcript_21968/m.76075 type:complete len:244 (+) Transcript_21968:548-1279(+)
MRRAVRLEQPFFIETGLGKVTVDVRSEHEAPIPPKRFLELSVARVRFAAAERAQHGARQLPRDVKVLAARLVADLVHGDLAVVAFFTHRVPPISASKVRQSAVPRHARPSDDDDRVGGGEPAPRARDGLGQRQRRRRGAAERRLGQRDQHFVAGPGDEAVVDVRDEPRRTRGGDGFVALVAEEDAVVIIRRRIRIQLLLTRTAHDHAPTPRRPPKMQSRPLRHLATLEASQARARSAILIPHA